MGVDVGVEGPVPLIGFAGPGPVSSPKSRSTRWRGRRPPMCMALTQETQ
ncbi:MAG: hypothetical protein MZV63_25765 [Marinilabiliales bacterium]|nr:hypothetical protein [Marinilabiliales bacterium]